MKWKNLVLSLSVMLQVAMLGSVGVSQVRDARRAQNARPPQRDAAQLETRVYRVRDFVLPTPNYSFQGIDLPSTDRTAKQGPAVGGGQQGGFFRVGDSALMQQGGGGMGGMSGGGFPATPGNSGHHEFRITMDDLIETVVATIEPETWQDVGGSGSIAELGGLLVIQQTSDVHQQIVRLLESLAKQGAAPKSMTIYAYWLQLDGNAIETLKKKQDLAAMITQLADRIVARGQISCFDGQSVHIVAGNLKSGVTSWTPVVGQANAPTQANIASRQAPRQQTVAVSTSELSKQRVTYLAQFEGQAIGGFNSILGKGDRSVGYRPEIKAINVGTMLQVTPVLSNAENLVALDVHNIVVSPPANKDATVNFEGQQIDRINVNAQQFRTTLQIPINETRIVGGISLQPTGGQPSKQLYLLMQVSPDK